MSTFSDIMVPSMLAGIFITLANISDVLRKIAKSLEK